MIFVGMATGLPVLSASVIDTNNAWLEMALTNGNSTAFIIHPPATNANGVFDLYCQTNPAISQDWTWLMRSVPGQTNLVVSNLPPGQAFFRLGFSIVRPGFDQQILPANDDDSTGIVPIGFPINFYFNTNTTLYVNNNGNVTFTSPQSAYSPQTLASLKIEVIAPFWADVDTRNPNSDVVTYGTNTVNGYPAFGVDWVNVGYYSMHADELLSCQMVIINRSDIAPGDFDLEFNYDKVQWQWGDVTVGVPARAGFANSSQGSYELPGSGINGAFMDTNTVTGLIYNSLNTSVPGRYVFRFRDGQPLF